MMELLRDTTLSTIAVDEPPPLDESDPYEELVASISFDLSPSPFRINSVSRDHSRTTTVEEDMRAFMPPEYWEFADIFSKTSFDHLPPHSEFDHAINLKDSFKPQKSKIYLISPREQKELDSFIEENLT